MLHHPLPALLTALPLTPICVLTRMHRLILGSMHSDKSRHHYISHSGQWPTMDLAYPVYPRIHPRARCLVEWWHRQQQSHMPPVAPVGSGEVGHEGK